jgi:hypothetical protein
MSAAILTIVHNERHFLPVWLRYYRKHFADADIYVMDNDTTDGSTDSLSCNVEHVTHDTAFDAAWLAATVSHRQAELLREYDVIVFAEADEFIVTKDGLQSSLERIKSDVIRVCGFEVMHIHKPHRGIKAEPPLDISQPILSQRHRWYQSGMFCKPTISRVPLRWKVGFHNCQGHNPPINNEFVLVHLHRVDLDIAIQRNAERVTTRKINRDALERRLGWQNFLGKNQIINQWWAWHKPLSGLVEIPEWIKGAL